MRRNAFVLQYQLRNYFVVNYFKVFDVFVNMTFFISFPNEPTLRSLIYAYVSICMSLYIYICIIAANVYAFLLQLKFNRNCYLN